ncbi:hypothetical protein FRB91_003888 [Serendipita sp. 411]|nr:hypothetical protein FRB91_003888 [Serendipita sp. 411]
MPFNEMKEALSELSVQLKVLEVLDDPRPHLSFPSCSTITEITGDAIFLIDNFEQTIISLSQNLYNMTQRYSALVASYAQRHLKPRISEIRSAAPQLPNEILIEIFGFLVEDGSHCVGPLLFVDKRFHALVVSTPLLWCNISIKFNTTFDESNGLSAQYINSCMKHSQSTLLNIALDMENVPTPEQYARSLVGGLEGNVSSHNAALSTALEAVIQQTWREDSDYYAHQHHKVRNLVKLITGRAGAHMSRWKSFKFLSSDVLMDEIGTIWKLFKYPTPNLDTFKLSGYIFDYGDELSVSFPNLAGVRHLTLPGDDLLRRARISYPLLRTLFIENYQKERLLDVLGGCSGLQELTISEIDGARPAPRVVNIPSLITFHLYGNVDIFESVTFQTPHLESLTLICDDDPRFPTVQARSVFWKPPRTDFVEEKAGCVKRLLVRMQGIEELTIDFSGANEIIPVVHEMIAQRDAAIIASLQVIRIADQGRLLESVHLSNV